MSAESKPLNDQIAQIEMSITSISNAMKGPMSNLERGFLHEDRKELRAKLAALKLAEGRQ